MFWCHIGERKPHPESTVGIDHLSLSLENTIVPDNSQLDQHPLRQWI